MMIQYMMRILFQIVYLLLSVEAITDEVPALSKDILQNSYSGRPICAFFKYAAISPDFERLFSKFLKSNDGQNYAEWTIGSVNLEHIAEITPPPNLYPSMVPSIQCDVGLLLPLEFGLQNQNHQSLKKWFKSVAKKHLKQPKIATVLNLGNSIFDNSEGITIVTVPGLEYFQYMEDIIMKVKKKTHSQPLEILISRPQNGNDREFRERFGIKKWPAVLFFTYEVWVEKKTFTHLLDGLREVRPESVDIILKTINMKAVFLDKKRFHNEMLDTKYQLPPKLVCVFSFSNPKSLEYITRFEEIRKQLECRGTALEFRLMNIDEKNNSQVFTRYVNATGIKTFPVFVLFWQEATPAYGLLTRQKVLDGIPTINQLYLFLLENSILDRKNIGKNRGCFSEEDDRSLECLNPFYSGGICRINLTPLNEVSVDKYSVITSQVESKKNRKSRSSKSNARREKIGNLILLSDDDWSGTMETSLSFPNTKVLHVGNDAVLPALNVIVFIIKDCRYCHVVMPALEKLAQAIHPIDRAALYLVNCSSSPAICNRYNTLGYPSIKLFRSIPWCEVGNCLTDQHSKQNIVQDFHGPIEPHHFILEWLSNSLLPVVRKEFLLKDLPDKMDHDVYLVGTVVTRSQALRFLPSNTYNKWYSFKCFQTACELLVGKAICYATMTKDFRIKSDMAATNNKDLFLVKLTLLRRDGVQSKVFELGVPVETTMVSEKDSQIHMFHNTHRYNVPKNFRCEDSHSFCTEFIVNYVTDHCRLPVTRLDHNGFHTINRFSYGDNNPSSSPPVAIVLAHKQNLTSESLYYLAITNVAYQFYGDIIFTALDVDEYPEWASRFVPKDYDTTQFFGSTDHSSTPPLYNFPRICIVMSTDHRQAAFFPSLQAMADAVNVPRLLQSVTAENIVEFVKHFLRHPEDLLVKTEMF